MSFKSKRASISTSKLKVSVSPGFMVTLPVPLTRDWVKISKVTVPESADSAVEPVSTQTQTGSVKSS